MGIKAEFGADLCLRNFQEFKDGKRKAEECFPEKMEEGKVYDFFKSGQRLYWLDGEQPLLETRGEEQLSDPKASILILEYTHFKENGKIYTRGKYKIIKILDEENIYFNGCFPVGTWN